MPSISYDESKRLRLYDELLDRLSQAIARCQHKTILRLTAESSVLNKLLPKDLRLHFHRSFLLEEFLTMPSACRLASCTHCEGKFLVHIDDICLRDGVRFILCPACNTKIPLGEGVVRKPTPPINVRYVPHPPMGLTDFRNDDVRCEDLRKWAKEILNIFRGKRIGVELGNLNGWYGI